MESKLPILIHVGLHKTGTTWLQQKILRPEAGRTIVYSEDWGLLRGNFCAPLWGDFRADNFHKELEELKKESADTGCPIVLSDEALAGFSFSHKFLREISLTRIKEAIPDAYVLVTIRAQLQVILSVYGHYIRGGGTASLENFLLQPEGEMSKLWTPILDLNFYDYSRLIDFCYGLFGESHTIVAPMEWMLNDTPAFLKLLSTRLDLPWADGGVVIDNASQVVNPAWSPIGFSAARLLNLFYSGTPRWLPQPRILKPNAWGARVDRFTPKAIREKQKVRQKEIIREKIHGFYAASNSRVSDMIGINLKDYGYET